MPSFGVLEQVEPAREFVRPTLRMRVKVEYYSSQEMPISFSGRLRLDKNRCLSGVSEGIYGGSNVPVGFHDLLVRDSNESARKCETHVEFLFPLHEFEVELIQRMREPNPQDDIRLTLEIQAQTLELKLGGVQVDYLKRILPGVQPASTLVALHDPSQKNVGGGVVLIRESQSGIQMITHKLNEILVEIPSSRWVRDYAPAFGVGETMTIEVPRQTFLRTIDGDLGKRLEEAAQGLQKMKEDIRKGEWTQCAVDSRHVLELLNKPELVRPLLATSGLPPDKEEALLKGLLSLYQYAHGFHHSIGEDQKTVLPAVNANPEDAYLVYCVAAGLLNAIGRKGNRKPAKS